VTFWAPRGSGVLRQRPAVFAARLMEAVGVGKARLRWPPRAVRSRPRATTPNEVRRAGALAVSAPPMPGSHCPLPWASGCGIDGLRSVMPQTGVIPIRWIRRRRCRPRSARWGVAEDRVKPEGEITAIGSSLAVAPPEQASSSSKPRRTDKCLEVPGVGRDAGLEFCNARSQAGTPITSGRQRSGCPQSKR
jgi:hypothetical protein